MSADPYAWTRNPKEPEPDGISREERKAWRLGYEVARLTRRDQQVVCVKGEYKVLEIGAAMPKRAKVCGVISGRTA